MISLSRKNSGKKFFHTLKQKILDLTSLKTSRINLFLLKIHSFKKLKSENARTN